MQRNAYRPAQIFLASLLLLGLFLVTPAGVSANDNNTALCLEAGSGGVWYWHGDITFAACAEELRPSALIFGTIYGQWGNMPIQVMREGSVYIQSINFWYYTPLLTSSSKKLTTYWSAQFIPGIYQSPSQIATPEYRPTAADKTCPPKPASEAAAYYCTRDMGIYYYDAAFRNTLNDQGEFGVVGILAHEWGHHIQYLLKIYNRPASESGLFEQQADCFAGLYFQSAEMQGDLTASDVGSGREALAVGDSSHGTAEARRVAFNRGYYGSISDCINMLHP